MTGIFKKICIVLTNRSEYAKVKVLMRRINRDPDLELKVLITGSMTTKRYGTPLWDIEKDGIKIDETIKAMIDGDGIQDIVKSSSLQMIEECIYFERNRPDLVILVGDRWEIIPLIFVLSLYCIPIAHIQGGEKSGTIDDVFRDVITKYSHIHFVSNEVCRERVLKLTEREEHVYSTGCPGLDIVNSIEVGNDVDLKELQPYIKDPFTLSKNDKYFMVMIHPNVTVPSDINVKTIFKVLSQFSNKKVWFYPNEDPHRDSIVDEVVRHRDIIKFSHIPLEQFIMLMAHSACFIGNSSSGIRETASFGVPTINIGRRQENRDRNVNTLDVNCNEEEIYSAILKSINSSYEKKNIYGNGNSSYVIIDIIKSYRSLSYKNVSI